MRAILEEKNPNWKGDDVGLSALHDWVKSRKLRPDKCEKCGRTGKVDLANISQEYKRDIDDWEWLCRKCHMLSDGRLKALTDYGRSCRQYPIELTHCPNCGSINVKAEGTEESAITISQRRKCLSCGKWSHQKILCKLPWYNSGQRLPKVATE